MNLNKKVKISEPNQLYYNPLKNPSLYPSNLKKLLKKNSDTSIGEVITKLKIPKPRNHSKIINQMRNLCNIQEQAIEAHFPHLNLEDQKLLKKLIYKNIPRRPHADSNCLKPSIRKKYRSIPFQINKNEFLKAQKQVQILNNENNSTEIMKEAPTEENLPIFAYDESMMEYLLEVTQVDFMDALPNQVNSCPPLHGKNKLNNTYFDEKPDSIFLKSDENIETSMNDDPTNHIYLKKQKNGQLTFKNQELNQNEISENYGDFNLYQTEFNLESEANQYFDHNNLINLKKHKMLDNFEYIEDNINKANFFNGLIHQAVPIDNDFCLD